MKTWMNKHLNLAVKLVLFVFGVMVATFLLIGISAAFLDHSGMISITHFFAKDSEGNGNPLFKLTMLFLLCILLGTALSAFLSNKALNPIRKIIDAIHKVARGDFHVKVDLNGIDELKELSQSFNKMTQELASIETLRSDFINNFSHEFKTPIVSIRGFAKLLKENKLSEQERREYLDIIITEAERLAELSTHVLMLSKYENLEIVADKEPFRLDEQIRRTIVLMEPKWSAKEITINVEMDNVIYIGSKDLTQQIWLNLLDNAIKFSHQGGSIHISLVHVKDEIQFVIHDEGPGMDEPSIARIFDKFYQGDPSHAKAGYGLGLPLVKRIVQLCGGTVIVNSEMGKGSKFTVVLPGSSESLDLIHA